MMVSTIDDFDYIFTDMKGVISSMTAPLAELLGIEHRWIHKAPGLNVQLLAPDLVDAYNNISQCKLKEEGGGELQIVVPEGLISYLQNHEPDKPNSEIRMLFKEPLAKYNRLLSTPESTIEITANDLWNLENYQNSTLQTKTKCQLQNLKFIINESIFFKVTSRWESCRIHNNNAVKVKV
jgi:hypothetical protein